MSNLEYLFPQKFIKPCLVSPHISGIHSTKSDFFFFCRMIAKGSNIRIIQMSSFQSIIQRNKDYNSNYKVLFFSILDHINNCYYLHFYFLKSRGNTESYKCSQCFMLLLKSGLTIRNLTEKKIQNHVGQPIQVP